MTDNITLLLSLDNYVYGVLTTALELCPFNLIKRMALGTTYLYGIKTFKVFATSKDIEDIITMTTNCLLKPLFLKNTIPGNVITTQYESNNTNVDYEFMKFCNDFVEDFETSKLVDKTFEDFQDDDMMRQCSILMDDYVEEVLMD